MEEKDVKVIAGRKPVEGDDISSPDKAINVTGTDGEAEVEAYRWGGHGGHGHHHHHHHGGPGMPPPPMHMPPPMPVKITTCPYCGAVNRANFPLPGPQALACPLCGNVYIG